MVKPGLVS